MRGQVAAMRTEYCNAQPAFVDVNGTIVLGTFVILFPLTIWAIVSRRKYRKRLLQERIQHLERSLRLKSHRIK